MNRPFLGRKHSAESKKKMSESHMGKRMGDKSTGWKGGISLQKDYKRNWEKLNPNKVHAYQKRWSKQNRLSALLIVGKGEMLCSNCKCDDMLLLEINHENGGGAKEQRLGLRGWRFYNAIIKGKRTTNDLNILCKVCNAEHYSKIVSNQEGSYK